MSRLGKSLRSKFLAMVLAGAMVMTSVVSPEMLALATESSDVETAEDVQTPSQASGDSEEAAEDEEIKQKDTEEIEAEEQDNKEDAESETAAKKESTTAVGKAEDDTEVGETDSEDSEEQQSDSVDNKADVIYTSDDAELVDGHTYAKWGLNETAIKDDGTEITSFEGIKGIYKNTSGDILYIDAGTSDSKGKFNPASGQVRNNTTKIYVPVKVENNEAKIILYQKNISSQDEVVYKEETTAARSFAFSGTQLANVQCSAIEKSGDYYRTELLCTLTGDTQSAIICIEAKATSGTTDNYISQIISGEEVKDDVYDDDYGNSKDLVKYNMEGFANAYGVTGGGVMKNTAANYYKVKDAAAFLDALSKIRKANKPAVIEVTGDLNLGSKEIGIESESFNEDYKSFIGADAYQALWHPTLIESGVSDLTLDGFNNLTIFSSNDKGSAIKHCNIVVKRSTNIIFRNFYFDELWEWDDGGTVIEEQNTYEMGGYKRNDWDYLCIDQDSDGIWIDHCTFYKSYDGLIDIKNPKTDGEQHVTISWCKFEPKSAPDENGNHPFFDVQLETMEKDISEGGEGKSVYYKSLRAVKGTKIKYTERTFSGKDDKEGTPVEKELTGEGYSFDDIVIYACGQKKAHLLGQDDKKTNAEGIRATFANNSWVNCMDRLPRLRRGIVHEYNCVLDASELYTAKTNNSKAKSHLVSNGAISTVGGSVFLENCYIDGIDRPLLSGNSKSIMGYIGSENCIYKQGTKETGTVPIVNNNTSGDDVGKDPLILTKAEFKAKLPDNYGSYELYAAAKLKADVIPYAGAGSVQMSAVQWTKTSYGERDTTTNPDEPESGESPGDEESSEENASVPVIEFSLRMDELDDGDLTADYTKNGFTIKVKSASDKVTVEANSKKVTGIKELEGETITKRLKSNGAGSANSKSIHFTAETPGTLTVYAVSASGSEDRELCLYKKGSKDVLISTQTALGSKTVALFYPIEESGEYYVAPKAGINFYYIAFSNKKEEDSETEGSGGSDVYDPMEVEAEWTTFSAPEGDSVYDADEGKDSVSKKYNQEGYAQAAKVTGGGLLKENDPGYYKVTNELEFIQAISDIFRVTDKPHVIEITTDLNLGNLELNEKYKDDKLEVTTSGDGYQKLFRAQGAYPLMHPILKETGVSYIKLHDIHNLTIFSKNGASIKHAEMNIEGGSSNIIIRNLTFDELWEWDEGDSKNKPGDYDRNDWDYVTIDDNADGVWIDHCTFYKAYDGIIDVKNPGPKDMKLDYERVTISWCEILPGSKDNTFFNAQMDWLEEQYQNNSTQIPYYTQMRTTENMSAEDVWYASYGQKKVHLFGAGDDDTQDKAIRVTLANNYYKNPMSRLPRLRFGKVHEYNCIFDAQELHDQHLSGNPHITGNGAISTCKGEMLIENCYISGLRSPLRSGYGGVSGYIKAVDTLYYMNGQPAELQIKAEGTDGLKVTDEVRFREKLPYSDYVKYDASKLNDVVKPYAGAGKLDLTTVQWERTNYNGEEGGEDEESSNVEGSSTEGGNTEESSTPESSETDASGSTTTDIYIVGLKESYDYTGDKITPDFDVVDYGTDGVRRLLTQGVDYTVTYKNNKGNPTETVIAEIIVKGKGNYAADKTSVANATFKIVPVTGVENPIDLKGAKQEGKIEPIEYDGTPQYPTFKLTLADKTTQVEYKYINGEYKKNGEDPLDVNIAVSNNINKGNATILVTGALGSNNKPTQVKIKFKITAASLEQATVTLQQDENNIFYSPNGASPEVTVTIGSGETARTLEKGKDYTVKYAKNKAAGEATVTVTGKGNYTKKAAPKPYTIKPAKMSSFEVKAVTAYEGIKIGKIAATVADDHGNVLKPNQYTLEYYTVIPTGDTKTKGTQHEDMKLELQPEEEICVIAVAKDSKNLVTDTDADKKTDEAFFVAKKNIAKAKFALAEAIKKGKAYEAGKEVKLAKDDLVVTYEGTPLVMNEAYEVVSYTNNINKGTATAVIKGIGDYSGTKTVKFKIAQKSVKDLKKWEEIFGLLNQATNILSIKQ